MNKYENLRNQLLFFLFFVLSATIVKAQNITVNGTVIDAKTEQSLPGVNILVMGTSVGTATDKDGTYSLSVSSLQDTLRFTYIGFQTREVPIDGRTNIDVPLKSKLVKGQELVVTALGIKREKRSLSYSTQSIDTEDLTKARELNVANSLSGKVAGLNIFRSGAGVGAESRINLRGIRSINGTNHPLYVVDGVPIQGGISSLNPDDIVNINVLKGPNAAALYGSQAQNGVIVITTEKGQKNKVKVNIHSTFMVRHPHLLSDFQNTYGQGLDGQYASGSGASWGPKMEGQMVEQWSKVEGKAGSKYPYKPRPNNISSIYENGYNLVNGFKASIGGDKTTGLISYTNTRGKGEISNNKLDRHNATVRITSQLTSKLSVDSKLSYINQVIDNKLQVYDQTRNVNSTAYRMPRSLRNKDVRQYTYEGPNGDILQNSWTPGKYAGSNPYWLINRDINNNSLERVLGLASLTYDFTNSLSLQVRTDYEGRTNNSQNEIYNGNYVIGQNGYFEVAKSRDYGVRGDFLVNYKKSLREDWSLEANLGGQLSKTRQDGISSNTGLQESLSVPNLFSLSNTQVVHSSYDYGDPINTQSLYGLVNIGWRDAIYLNITGRNDWTSTLPPNNRSYFYPSAGLSAVISDLIPDVPEFISFAKISASYAQVGNGAEPFLTHRYANFSKGGNNGFLQVDGTLPANNLKPEETSSYDIGFNIRFLEDRLGLNISAYKTNTENQLFRVSLPIGSGASEYYTNAGNIQNKGLEVNLNTTLIQSKDFGWNVDMNYSMNRNKVKEIYGDREALNIEDTASLISHLRLKVGDPFGDRYTKGFVRDTRGRVIVGDNGIPQITSGYSIRAANFNPDWTGSIHSSFSYKYISLGFLISRRQGGTIVSRTDAWMASQGVLKRTLPGREGGVIFGKDIFQKETAVDKNGNPNKIKANAEDFWKTIGGRHNQVGEAFVESATNMRLKELSITYSLPESLLTKLSLSKLSVSLVGRNLFFFSRSANFDPSVRQGTGNTDVGFNNFTPPNPRRYGISIEIGL